MLNEESWQAVDWWRLWQNVWEEATEWRQWNDMTKGLGNQGLFLSSQEAPFNGMELPVVRLEGQY